MCAKLHPETSQLHSAMHKAEFLRALCLQRDLEATKIGHRIEKKNLGPLFELHKPSLFSSEKHLHAKSVSDE